MTGGSRVRPPNTLVTGTLSQPTAGRCSRSTLTKSNQIATTVTTIGTALSQLRVARKKPGREAGLLLFSNGAKDQLAAAGTNFAAMPSSGLKVCLARSV
jgi:hypothetical protein